MLSACNFTTTKPREFQFNDVKAVEKELLELVTAENIYVIGMETRSNGLIIKIFEIT